MLPVHTPEAFSSAYSKDNRYHHFTFNRCFTHLFQALFTCFAQPFVADLWPKSLGKEPRSQRVSNITSGGDHAQQLEAK